MSNDTPDISNPFHDRPDSKEAKQFDHQRNVEAERRLEIAAREGRNTLFQKTVDGRDIITGTDADIDEKRFRRGFDGTKKGRDAIFMFPESYNLLRRELAENWPELWALVGWRMANRAEEFVEYMNEATGLAVQFDTDKVDFISTTFLDKLVAMRIAATAPVVLLRDISGKGE